MVWGVVTMVLTFAVSWVSDGEPGIMSDILNAAWRIVPFGLAWFPARLVFDRLRKREIGDRHCRKCDYNLTGNVSGVCPECGEKITATTVASDRGQEVAGSDRNRCPEPPRGR
jgi:hypothetical protein